MRFANLKSLRIKRTRKQGDVIDARGPRCEGDEPAYCLSVDYQQGVWYWEHELEGIK